MRGKKAQESSAGSAAALVSIIALLIVVYVLFLPPDVRNDLLEGGSADSGNSGAYYPEGGKVILLENPGRLDFIMYKEYEHDISPIYLLKTSESKTLKEWNTFHIKNGVFDMKKYETSFSLADLDNTKNLLLAFNPAEAKGTLLIRLNSRIIFEKEIKGHNIDPIKIPDELLKEKNTLEFEVSSVGWRFWSTNEYVIEGMKIIAQVTDTSRQQSRNIFVVRDMEYFNLDRAGVRFTPECSAKTAGVLEMYLNDRLIFSGVPDCGIPNFKEFASAYLDRGENSLIFKTLSGSYLIDSITVKTELKDQNFPLYSFDINESTYDDIENGNADVKLSLSFFNDPSRKQGIIYVNGKTLSFSTTVNNWERSIASAIKKDDNWIKIVPDKSALDILELKVALFNNAD